MGIECGLSCGPAADGSLMALVDCDSFYASCERVGRPDLVGRPIVVLSNNDGCIVSRNREAKDLGIPMGEPEFKARQLLREHGVAVFSSNYALYGDLSTRVMQTISSVVPDIEIYSIDEAFVPMGGALAVNADDVARKIRERVWRWVGLPVSIGLAPTRVLAKIATAIAKKYRGGGIFNMCHCQALKDILSATPVRDIWGIGRRGAVKLKMAGIHTALELRDADPGLVRSLLTVHGLNIVMELRGIPAIKEDIPATHTTIISSRSLGNRIHEIGPLEEAIAFHAARAAEKLRQKRLVAGMLGARIQTGWHGQHEPRHDEMAMVRLLPPTMDTAVLIAAAHRGLRRIFRTGYAYAKVMVMLTDLSDPMRGQQVLPIQPCEAVGKQRKRLLDIVDRINRVEGRETLYFASQGAKDAVWHMKRENLSPAWTTDVSQLLRVRGTPQN